MLAFPNAKINLGLQIISKRADGYHNIQSCFYPIPWYDALEILPSNHLTFTSSGLDIPGSSSSNLCLKAYKLIQSEFKVSPVHIHLHKAIPMGAGLGGGSADGAFTLKMLNDLFGLNLSGNELRNLAAKLGSDCPFFIDNKTTLASGTGTEFTNTNLSLNGYHLAIKNPGIHISTQEAYANVNPGRPQISINELIKLPLTEWKKILKNDFEDSVFPNHPKIKTMKEELYTSGAIYASMTGSGSTVYGLFEKPPMLPGYRIMRL